MNIVKLMMAATMAKISNMFKPSPVFQHMGTPMRKLRKRMTKPQSQGHYNKVRKDEIKNHAKRYPARQFDPQLSEGHAEFWRKRGYNV